MTFKRMAGLIPRVNFSDLRKEPGLPNFDLMGPAFQLQGILLELSRLADQIPVYINLRIVRDRLDDQKSLISDAPAGLLWEDRIPR